MIRLEKILPRIKNRNNNHHHYEDISFIDLCDLSLDEDTNIVANTKSQKKIKKSKFSSNRQISKNIKKYQKNKKESRMKSALVIDLLEQEHIEFLLNQEKMLKLKEEMYSRFKHMEHISK
jgi:hypothetical protein